MCCQPHGSCWFLLPTPLIKVGKWAEFTNGKSALLLFDYTRQDRTRQENERREGTYK